MTGVPSKVCPACGREFSWRKKWERDWEQVKYCSNRCKGWKPSELELAIETAILDLLRSSRGTICPSQAAKLVAPNDWNKLMEQTRAAARRLVHARLVSITQGGRVVDPSTANGPIRLRLAPGVSQPTLRTKGGENA